MVQHFQYFYLLACRIRRSAFPSYHKSEPPDKSRLKSEIDPAMLACSSEVMSYLVTCESVTAAIASDGENRPPLQKLKLDKLIEFFLWLNSLNDMCLVACKSGPPPPHSISNPLTAQLMWHQHNLFIISTPCSLSTANERQIKAVCSSLVLKFW